MPLLACSGMQFANLLCFVAVVDYCCGSCWHRKCYQCCLWNRNVLPKCCLNVFLQFTSKTNKSVFRLFHEIVAIQNQQQRTGGQVNFYDLFQFNSFIYICISTIHSFVNSSLFSSIISFVHSFVQTSEARARRPGPDRRLWIVPDNPQLCSSTPEHWGIRLDINRCLEEGVTEIVTFRIN